MAQWIADNIEWVLGALVLVAGGGILAWYKFIRVDTRTADASIKETEAKTENQLAITVANLGVELSRLNGEMSQLRQKYRELEDLFDALKDQHEVRGQVLGQYRKGVKVLVRQLKDVKIEPAWSPPD